MANRDICPTTLIEVKPGDETGIYHIIFCNLPFKATWQELKDWLSESCAIDFVEIFPVSCSGWVCIHGKEKFETVLAYMKTEYFKGRHLIFDDKNKSEPIRIRVRVAGPKPKYAEKYSCLMERSQERRASSRNEAIYAATTAEMTAFTDFMAVLLCIATLYKPPPALYYPPALTFPGNEWDNYHGMSPCAPCPISGDMIPTPPDSPEGGLHESAAAGGDEDDKDDQYYLGEIQGNARERRAQSVPPSFRWAGNETSE
ncbi:uncharacterized protein TrAFT101_003613 [Trichoderma asperellum]|uniref:RRM domain-containing protein n=1 Tax=Trichoderma asperellum (strain ATCC 204424 / CBS 433.97 / NBRC 101777) TaxID=1042311 RepID=A0A2T3ZQ63_TRIA4|nr:hypothetical protein M441DRAFT_22903 [Trichoderma asperellum CBS 433.97]PTB46951.1 hypothetical protein M441DRAFT_22903 [Trichoderma asperellum CBS 433.97]UKZ87837.1 hypothetical protein TrAFT101_003613 [Trichoderma asperellum]